MAQPAGAAELEALVRGVDVAIVVAYGRIIPLQALEAVPFGFVNVHFSLLPRWRGAAPVQHAILAGDESTGVSLMQLDEGLDTGPVLGSIEVTIGDDERAGELTARLAGHGAELLGALLPPFVEGRIAPELQDGRAATAAPRIVTADAQLTKDMDATRVLRTVRAFHPKPGAWMLVDGDRVKALDAAPAPAGPEPGLIEAGPDGALLGTIEGAVELLEVQPEGKAPMSGRAWMNGRRGSPGRVGS